VASPRTQKYIPVESRTPEEYRVWTERPPDPGPGRIIKPLVLVTPEGDTLRVFQMVEELEGGRRRVVDGPCRILGHESHFATCPNADDFRKERP
jgi:hypothetical protein